MSLYKTELFEIELFWHLIVNKNYTYSKPSCLKFGVKWPEKGWYTIKQNQPTFKLVIYSI